MAQIFEFRDEILGGCRIKMRVNEDESLSGICAECVKRVCGILESMHFKELVKTIKNKNFAIVRTIPEILLAEEETVFEIKSI